ncbi:MAG: hypothetical protein JRH19_21800 [Deltaproteobacteria bacterium]|nr:hypothetical protein [Deltaproteobacteria bacterium]
MFSDLERHERRVYSQNGEDGVLQRIFELVGTSNRYFVEFGAWDGQNLSNTAHLRLDHGWAGLLMEGSDRADDAPVERELVDAENVNALFAKYGVPEDFDLLSIDIDGNDYWVWKAIEGYTPRVVVIEYNALFGNRVSKAMRYDAGHVWDKTPYHGASLAALRKLGHAKGYALIYTDSWTPNAFFVHRAALPADFSELPIEGISRGEWYQEPPDTEHRPWVAV